VYHFIFSLHFTQKQSYRPLQMYPKTYFLSRFTQVCVYVEKDRHPNLIAIDWHWCIGNWWVIHSLQDATTTPVGTSRPFIYEIDSDVIRWCPFRRTVSKIEDSNKETSLKAFT